MSIRLMSLVFETTLETRDKFILLAMADYASDSGDSIFPSVETLTRKTSLSERSVQEGIKSLLALGFIIITTTGGGAGRTNHYKIKVAKLREGKGAESAPLQDEKGANPAEKGAEFAEKGAATAPDPSLTIKEPSVNTPNFRLLSPKQSYKVEVIDIYRQITGRDPSTEQCYVIYEMLQGKQFKIEDMERAWREWIKRGYRTSNLGWIDWGLAGEIPDREGNFPKAVAPEKKAEWDERLAAAEKRQAEEKARKIEEAKRLYSQLPPKFEETMAKLAAEKSI